MEIIIINTIGDTRKAYTVSAFINLINECYIDSSLDDTKNDKINSLDEAIEWYIDKSDVDDCIIFDILEVQE